MSQPLMGRVAAVGAIAALWLPAALKPAHGDPVLDMTQATIVVRSADVAPLPERTAADVLIEEVEKRSGVRWRKAESWPADGWAIALLSGRDPELRGVRIPDSVRISKAEGFGLATDLSDPHRPVLWIVGADPRGALFGVGRVLRNLEYRRQDVRLAGPLNLTSSPAYRIRGHQLGYRATANSYDAWNPAQFDQYIRELALFGTNSIEGIPFQDTRPTVNTYPRSKMNVDLSRICERYGLDYWVWVPADFDLKDGKRRQQALKEQETLFEECPTLTGVFVPGGDPGDNPPDLVIPYLTDLARLLRRHHPHAKVWLSLQGFSGSQEDYVFRWLERERPKWLGGLVAGPSSPPIPELRARLPKPYELRDYPDITHSVRCQFFVPWWDPAFAFTLGREGVNPRPVFFSRVIHDTAPFTDGFISYSDGVHDDVNKVIWSAEEWDQSADLNEILSGYCRLHFGPDVANSAAAGLLALERDWDGPLATNGGVDATFALWRALEAQSPGLKDNWRWQLCLLRAYYDMYTRQRLLYESGLEDEANHVLLSAGEVGSETAVQRAREFLKRAETAPIRPDLASRIAQLCADLYKSIGLQTSVEKYHASGSERGAVLDFRNYPLNNRWWLEDEMAKAEKLGTDAEKVARLEQLATWENPGPGSFYDDIGNVAKSPHEVRNAKLTSPLLDVDNTMSASFMFWVGDNPLARMRQSWISYEDWPAALKYVALDPEADYIVRTTGFGDCFLRANGVRIAPTRYGKELGAIKEFPVPRGLHRDGTITLTFDPTFEPDLNWRVESRLTEVWLIRISAPGSGAGGTPSR